MRRTRFRIDLLLTDVVMPHVNGWELAQRLRPARPVMKVLYMTGYSEIAATHAELGSESNAAWLFKPFTPDLLARRVHQVLDPEGTAVSV